MLGTGLTLTLKLGRLRQLSQVVFLVLSNIGFEGFLKTGIVCPYLFCYGCPVASVACPIGTLQHFAIIRLIPFYLIGIVGSTGIFFGRAFCGWACPFGALHDLLARFRLLRKAKFPQFKPGKYLMLTLVLALAILTSETLFCKVCPAGSLFAAIPGIIAYPWLRFGVYFYAHLATLAIILVFGLIVARFWCRYICPFGSVGSFNVFSSLGILRDSSRCDNCGECLDSCPMGIKSIVDTSADSDCIRCGRCIEACKKHALRIGWQ